MAQFIQCRLRRRHITGPGYSEMVTYLPTRGTNGRAVAAGLHVSLTDDPDQRPWCVLAASSDVVDERFIQRKYDERRVLARNAR